MNLTWVRGANPSIKRAESESRAGSTSGVFLFFVDTDSQHLPQYPENRLVRHQGLKGTYAKEQPSKCTTLRLTSIGVENPLFEADSRGQ